MTTAYTPILQLALPVTGELNGTWGDVVNNNITSMVEQAIAGLATINTWTTASHTLTTADGTTDEARCAILQCSGAPGAAATVICPAFSKVYIIKNSVTGGFAVTLKTSAGTGISVANGSTALLYCDGTNVVSGGGLGGDVIGPASATDTAIATFDGVTGKLIKNNASVTIAANIITALGFSGPHNGTVGATTPNTAAVTTLSATGAITSTLVTGTAPLVVASTTKVANLNVDQLDGADWASPAAIGSTAPAAGAFTTLSSVGTTSATAFKVANITETANIVASAPSATTNFYVNAGAVQFYTTNAANNWTLNLAFSSGTSLNTAMAIGDSISATMLSTQGATAYYNTAVTIDGTSVTPKWQGGTAPTTGNVSGIDIYTYAIIKTASATYTVLASQTQFK
jgi:hypothetical protein